MKQKQLVNHVVALNSDLALLALEERDLVYVQETDAFWTYESSVLRSVSIAGSPLIFWDFFANIASATGMLTGDIGFCRQDGIFYKYSGSSWDSVTSKNGVLASTSTGYATGVPIDFLAITRLVFARPGGGTFTVGNSLNLSSAIGSIIVVLLSGEALVTTNFVFGSDWVRANGTTALGTISRTGASTLTLTFYGEVVNGVCKLRQIDPYGVVSRTLHSARMKQTSVQSIADNSDVTVSFQSSEIVTGCTTSTGTNRITIQRTGRYRISGVVTLNSGSFSATYSAKLRVNGSLVARSSTFGATSGEFPGPFASIVLDLAASDYVTLVASQTTGSAKDTAPLAGVACYLEVIEIPTEIMIPF